MFDCADANANVEEASNFCFRSDSCVDVIIAAWNCEHTIGRAVASALAQIEVHAVIVVDDASSDNTGERAYDADDGSGRLTVFRFPENMGPAAARNKALSLCKAPWVAILDGDDYLLPGRFSRLLAKAEGWDFVADNLLQVPEDHGYAEVLLSASGKKRLKPYRCDFETFIRGNISRPGRDRKELGFLQPLIRRSFLVKHGLRYDESIRLGEDYAFCAHALACGARFLVVPVLGYVAVVRGNSLSSSASKKHFERLRDIDLALEEFDRLTEPERAAVRAHYRSVDSIVQWMEVIEAIKDRNAVHFWAAYTRSLSAARYISARLCVQIVKRSFWRISQVLPAAGITGGTNWIPVDLI